ncbi:MAG TPA: ribosome-recycling factor, partial [Candidatus Paceibacterota bacterium]|nr:ribosome-recycling factor [Candidatus Paceibacterota bacterium]
MFNFQPFKLEIANVEKWLEKEFSLIRVGRANPAVLDGVKVDSYGAAVALNQVANIMIEDARSIRISPWDASQIKTIEKA